MIYLFDKDEKLFKIINKPALKTVLQKYALTTEQYVSDRLTVEMKSLDTDELEKVEYMAIQTIEDAHTFHYFYVAQKHTDQLTTLIGVQSGIEELRKTPVLDKRPKNAFAKNVINDLLKGTNWQARFVGETTQRSTSFYYISVFEALKKVCKVWDLEMQFFVEMNGNKIGARYIDFKRKIGSAVGKRVVYGHNALQILQEVERTNLFTALIGRGKGEQVSSAEESDKKTDGYGRKITFENVVWDVAKGNPVNKPKGQRFVELPEMTKVYGIKNTDGSIRPKIGFVDFQEEEDPGVLLERTYKALVDTARPQLTLKTTSAYLRGVKVGDTIRVVRHDKKLDYDTRIFEITFNRLNNESSDIKLGDRIGESNEAKAQTIAEKVVDDFVSNEFSDFVQKLPDFLPSPDGFNNNWYGAEDPTVKYPGKVLINDIWFKPDPEHEGHKIMLRWTGEVWDEILRSYDKELLTKRISEEIANFDKTFQSVNEQNKEKIDEILQSSGASSSLAQEAKRIGLDSVAKLEEFKRQATSAQTTLAGDLDVLKLTIANNIRPKQEQVTAEIEKQVKALIQTKNELAGVKSAQATYEETTTRRLSELTNLANGKASKSDLVQTAEELASKIASAQVGNSRNYFRDSRSRTFTTGNQATYDYRTFIVPDFWKNNDRFKRDYVRISFDVTFPVALANDLPAMVHFSAHPWYAYKNLVFKGGTTERQHFEFTIDLSSSSETYQTNNVFIRFGTNYGFPAGLQVIIENAMLSIGNYFPAYQPAYEDQEDRVTVVESNFKQRADSLDASVNRLTEGLRTKADISSLNVTAENIRQSVKSLETNTQNKLNQMLSLAEFEVRAGSIRQEILNATKEKADKTLVVAEAGKLREEFSSLRVGGRNFIRNYDWNRLLPLNGAGPSWEFERVEDQFAKSGYMLKATCTKNGNGGFHKAFFDLRAAEFQGKDMTWSWDIKSSRPITFYAMGFEAGGLKRNVPVSTEWERISNTFKVAFKQYYSCVFYANGWEVGDVVYIRDPQLEEGTIATSPKPAPEDTDGLITEAKDTFERTAEGLRTDLSAIQEYVSQDGQRQEVLRRYTREESAKQATAVRELVAKNYVGKATYQEDVRGIENRFEGITNPQNGSIATQIANYKKLVDGRFADITSMISGKANQTDFQRVKETSQLYERILGSTDNGIADNVARMAVTNQIFQVEVGKYGGGGPNLVKNSDFKDGTSEWSSTQNLGRLVKHGFYHNSQKDIMRLSNSTQSENFLYSPRFELERNTDYVLNFRGFNNSNLVSYDVFILGRRAGENNGFTIIKQVVSGKKLSNARCEDVSVTFNSGEMDNAFIRFDNNGSRSGTADLYITEVDLYKGYKPRPWQPHPEDVITDANAKLEAIRTQMTLLQGSWSVQNLTSAGSIVSQINATNNQILIEAEKIRLKGKTLLDELTAIQGYFKRLFVGEGTFATLNADVIRTNSITADKLVFNEALANRLVSNEIITSKLVASRAFVNALKAVTIDASQIVTGTLKGDRIYGGTIRGTNIYGGTLTGHTQIQLGSYGSFDTVNGGLQINVPRTVNAKDGLGVQFIGSYGRGENVPYGLFIYKDSDFTVGGTAETSDDFLLTVEGYINAKGIGWLRTGKGSVNGKTTGTIGLWNSDNVSLSFGGSGNDIYYSYNGTAYSLWSVVNQHFSDRRLKENVVDCEHKALDYIQQFQFKEYDWKKQKDRPQQAHTKIGLIAQEVQEIDPTLVYENGDTLNLDNLRLTTIALKAIQELSQRIETLERKLA